MTTLITAKAERLAVKVSRALIRGARSVDFSSVESAILKEMLQLVGDKAAEKAFRKHLSESLEVAEQRVLERVRLLRKGFSGTRTELKRAIRELVFSNTKAFIETTASSHRQIATMARQWQTAMDPDVSDLVWGFRYRGVLDSNIREEHERLNGVELPKDHPFWDTYFPPNGYNCRCSVVVLDKKPARVSRPPKVGIDEAFAFNPGKLFGATNN